jgi:2-keto-4-pentenoate hydratase/2-oxohepta-3-ene-1,7-dioic acid hydratase in catechol pathway
MKLVTFERGGPRLGLVSGNEQIIDLASVGDGRSFPKTMIDLIFEAKRLMPRLEELTGSRDGERLPLSSVRLLAPIPRPLKNVFCVGRNYAAHAAEGARVQGREVVVPEFPEFFTKPPTAVTGHDSRVAVDPGVTQKFDYEVELGVVIGTAGKDIPRERALDHIFGFTIINDLTARDLQRRHGQWFKGKGLDGSCPMGPWIITKDALPNFADLAITLRVNGETRQQSRTSNMVHDIPTIIEHLSRGMTLEPGDVIATGTPEGVGYAMDPPRFLKAGDTVEAEVEGIGVLRSRIE